MWVVFTFKRNLSKNFLKLKLINKKSLEIEINKENLIENLYFMRVVFTFKKKSFKKFLKLKLLSTKSLEI